MCTLTTFEAVRSRHAMENAFLLQLEGNSRKMDELVSAEPTCAPFNLAILFQQGLLNQINIRSEKLKDYDDRAKKALEERNRRYREWKAWKPDPGPSTKGFKLGVRPKIPQTPTEGTLVAAYGHTGLIQGFPS